jgi:hypothetical protein
MLRAMSRASVMRSAFVVALAAVTPTCAPDSRPLPPCDASPALPNVAKDAAVVTVAAVGDVADCAGGSQMAVADTVTTMKPDAVFALGDLAYPNANIDELVDCYGPTLGRFRSITRAVPGNHEYHTPHAGAYYAYFCGSSGETFKGWYSFDIGRWHVVALNSNCGGDLDVVSDVADDFGGCDEGSPQTTWLRADLDAHPTGCTLAMWHHPRFSSSTEGPSPMVDTLWRIVVEHGVDVVLNGHAHDYQRFPPLAPDGRRDDAKGTRNFIVGTGGVKLTDFDPDQPIRSEVRENGSHGALRLELREHGYAWSFVPIDGDTLHDDGEATCRR